MISSKWFFAVTFATLLTLGSTPAQALIVDPYATAATPGVIAETFDFAPTKFVEHPTLPILYASIRSTNSVAIINTETLQLIDNVFIGSSPMGLAVSPDGQRLYASTGSNFLGVMDTTTNTLLTPIDIGTPTRDIEALSNNRLIAVTGQDSNWSDLIEIVLPPAGPAQITTLPAGFISVYSGELALAPDRQTVFYGNFGLSAATFAKINVSVPGTISIPFNTSDLGGNGQDVGLSRDGSLVGFAVGGGNDIAYPYDIGVIRTSDMAVLGSFNTGAYPREIEFAPDAGFAYTVNDSGEIKVFSTQTFLKTDTFTFTESPSHEEAQELFVEKSGQYLFASTSDQLLVYQTGRLIPIPEPSSIALFGLAAIALQKRRRQAAM